MQSLRDMEGEMLRNARNGNGDAREPELAALFEDLYRRSAASTPSKLKLRRWVELAEAWRIAAALHEHRGNRSAAARSLGIGRRTLYSKMERLGIRPSWGLPGAPDAPPLQR